MEREFSMGNGVVGRVLKHTWERFGCRFTGSGPRRDPAWWDELAECKTDPGKSSQRVNEMFRTEQTEFWQEDHRPTRMVVLSDGPSHVADDHEKVGDETAPEKMGFDERVSSLTQHHAVDSVSRPVVAPCQQSYADRQPSAPRFSMARYLRLNGMLDDDNDDRYCLELPRHRFRAPITFVREKSLSVEPQRTQRRAQWVLFKG